MRAVWGWEDEDWGGPRWVGRIFTDGVRRQCKPSTGTGRDLQHYNQCDRFWLRRGEEYLWTGE